jgi:hypothetical protein
VLPGAGEVNIQLEETAIQLAKAARGVNLALRRRAPSIVTEVVCALFLSALGFQNLLFDDDESKQECHGSREAYARRAAAGGFLQELSAEAMAFIAQRNSADLATASADG